MTTGTQLQFDVKALLNEHGQDVTFRRVTEGSYNPATGTTAASSTSDETVKVAFLQYRVDLVDGVNIQRGDRKAVMSAFDTSGAALSKTPQTGDQLVGVGQTVQMVDVQRIQSGGNDLAFVCQVRQ